MVFTRCRLLLILLLVMAAGAAATSAQTELGGAHDAGIDWTQRLLASQNQAIDQVVASAASPDAQLRANAMEASAHLPAARALPLLHLGFTDQVVPVRFAALVTAGRQRFRQLVPSARQVAADPGQNPHVRAAALFALSGCGQRVDMTPLAAMLESPEPSLRGNAAMLLGLAGNRSAIPMLSVLGRQALPATVSPVRGVIVRIQVAEALVRLGDESGLSMIRGGLYSSYDEVRVLAAAMIGRLCDDRMEEALFGIIDDKRESTIELRLAAIEALARLERNLIVVKETLDRADLAVSVANGGAPALRAQAAQALGALERARQRGLASLHGLQSTPPQNIGQRFEQTGTAAALLQLLADESEQVRLAAAAAILEPRGS